MSPSIILIGGEESGGYAFRGHVPERDGILANLYLLDLMRRTGKKPTELLAMLFELVGGPHYYDRIDFQLPDEETKRTARARLDAAQPATVGGLAVVEKNTTDGYLFVMDDGGWLAAGTLLRHGAIDPGLLRNHV
jgi:phosphomannomutase